MYVKDGTEVSLLAVSVLEFRYICQPFLIRRFSLEFAVQQVLSNMLRCRAYVLFFLPSNDRLYTCKLHKPLDPLGINSFVCVSTELDGMSSVTVDASHPLVNGQHLFRQLLVLLFTRAGFVVCPLVIAGPLNPGNLTQQLHAKRLFFMYRLNRHIHMGLSMSA